MKRYFIHQLKAHSRAIIIISVLMMIISFFTAIELTERPREARYADDGENIYWVNDYYYGSPVSYLDYQGNSIPITNETVVTRKYNDLGLTCPTTILFLLAVIVPAWMFGFMKKKRNLDCIYSLPITKRGIGVVHYLLGFIAVLVPFISSYAVMLICNACRGYFGSLAHGYIALHFGICLLAAFVIYSLSCFAFDKANTVIDGVIMIGVYSFLLCAFLLILEDGAYNIYYTIESFKINPNVLSILAKATSFINRFASPVEYGMPYYYFLDILDCLEKDAELVYTYSTAQFFEYTSNIVYLVIWSAVGLISAFGLIYGFDKKKAEDAEEISSSIFCYKLIIPSICIFSNVCFGIFDNDTAICLIMTIVCIIAYTVYRRGIRYKTSDYIVIGIMVLLTICSLFVHDAIERHFITTHYYNCC